MIAMDTSVAGVTVRLAAGEVTPFNAAVMGEEPAATAVARPVLLMVAIAGVELHDTDEEIS